LLNVTRQNTNDEQAQQINLLRLQILELQRFIFSGRQEKFKLSADSNERQTALFANDKLGEVVLESTQHVKGYEKNKAVVRVNHPGRKPLSEHLRREEIILIPAEDVTGLAPIGEEVTEILEYRQGELYVKKYIRPEYIKPTADGTGAKRVIAPLPNMPIAKSYVSASLLSHLMVSKYVDHLPVYRKLQMFSRQKINNRRQHR
jgi:transposase